MMILCTLPSSTCHPIEQLQISKDWQDKKMCEKGGLMKNFLTRATANAGTLDQFSKECKKGCDDNMDTNGQECQVAYVNWDPQKTEKICNFYDGQCKLVSGKLSAATGNYIYEKPSTNTRNHQNLNCL